VEELDRVLRVGYNRRGSNEFLAIRECPILAPLLWRAVEALTQIAADNSPAARWIRSAGAVEFFTKPFADETKLQMTVFARKEQVGLSAFCESMQRLVPERQELTSLNRGPKRRTKIPRQLEGWGAEDSAYQRPAKTVGQ
jgi:23S rRNA (uracil1939-C5)-methyltransferase